MTNKLDLTVGILAVVIVGGLIILSGTPANKEAGCKEKTLEIRVVSSKILEAEKNLVKLEKRLESPNLTEVEKKGSGGHEAILPLPKQIEKLKEEISSDKAKEIVLKNTIEECSSQSKK